MKEGEKYLCTVCGIEAKITKSGEPVVPLMCCDIVMKKR